VPEEVQGTDDLLTQPHRQRVRRGEAVAHRVRGKPRPWRGAVAKVNVEDRPRRTKAIQTWPLVVLQFEQFQQPGLLTGSRRHTQLP
jgi:hypothetical protein